MFFKVSACSDFRNSSHVLNTFKVQSEERKRAKSLKSKVNQQHASASVRKNSIFHRICRFSGDISFPRISTGCLSMQRERIHSSRSFPLWRLWLWAGSRTAQEGKLLDQHYQVQTSWYISSPEGTNQILWWVSGTGRERCRVCVWVCTPPRHTWCSFYQQLPEWAPGFPGVCTLWNLLSCLQVCAESGG